MNHKLLLMLCLGLSACAGTRRPVPYAPLEEAVWFKFPEEFPEEGRKNLSGPLATAIQRSMDDFLPWGTEPPRGASREEACLHHRQSYDVTASPGAEGVIRVSIALSPGACTRGGPLLDAGAEYAVDVRNGRIHALPEEAAKLQLSSPPPEVGRQHLEGNSAAALLLALEDFLPQGTQPPPGTAPEEACLYRRESYDVTAAPGPQGVMLVRFLVNDGACPPSPHQSVDATTGRPPVTVTTYAVDLRPLRILAVGTHVRPPRPPATAPGN